jgi:hypothetical protein
LPGIRNVDFSINKNWKVGERYGVQFRAEMFNVFNHANFTGLDNGLSFQGTASDANFGRSLNGNFGRLGGDTGPRVLQFGLKFTF